MFSSFYLQTAPHVGVRKDAGFFRYRLCSHFGGNSSQFGVRKSSSKSKSASTTHWYEEGLDEEEENSATRGSSALDRREHWRATELPSSSSSHAHDHPSLAVTSCTSFSVHAQCSMLSFALPYRPSSSSKSNARSDRPHNGRPCSECVDNMTVGLCPFCNVL